MKRRILLQLFLLVTLMGGTLFCSNNNNDEAKGDDGGEGDGGEDDAGETPTLSLNGTCYSCTQGVAAGDTCGEEMISGNESEFSFEQEQSTVSLDINNQISLSGTYEEGVLNLTNARTSFVGPGCNMTFTNIALIAELKTNVHINIGWTGTLSYDLSLDDDDADCSVFPFTTCRAVHSVTCNSGC